MKYYKNPQDQVFGYDEDQTDLITAAINANWTDISNAWPPAPDPKDAIVSQIAALEAQQTDRRVRDAIAGTDNGWLKNLETQIAALRAQL